MWKLNYIDVAHFGDTEGLDIQFNEVVDTLTVEDGKIVKGKAHRSRVYDKVTRASADRIQRVLQLLPFAFNIMHYYYSDGIIVEYRVR